MIREPRYDPRPGDVLRDCHGFDHHVVERVRLAVVAACRGRSTGYSVNLWRNTVGEWTVIHTAAPEPATLPVRVRVEDHAAIMAAPGTAAEKIAMLLRLEALVRELPDGEAMIASAWG